jgi:iron complex transport system substrate-binding protein
LHKKTVFLFLLLVAPALSAQEKPALPRRVISMAPNLTEIVYDIGGQDLLVGVTDFCKFPPEAQKKEKVGGWINPNYERILSLKADLVLALKFHGKAVDNLQKLHVPLLVFNCQTVEDVLDAYDILGKKLGREAQARKAKKAIQKRLILAAARAGQHKPVSVLFLIGRNPGTLDQLYGVGPQNFVDELIRKMGGVNMLSDAREPYPLVSKEQLLKRDPDIIIDSIPSSEMNTKQLQAEKESWKKFPALKAVREKRVFTLSEDAYLIPGPTMVGLAEYLSKVFAEVHD